MTKRYETVEVPAKTIERCVGRSCDLCGREAKGGDEWSLGTYEVNETEVSITVKQRDGDSYPEGGSGHFYDIDICPDCFKDKLVPWFVSQGADIEREDWGW